MISADDDNKHYTDVFDDNYVECWTDGVLAGNPWMALCIVLNGYEIPHPERWKQLAYDHVQAAMRDWDRLDEASDKMVMGEN